ncbi:hypothetical protein Sa4125_15430 [Aureimonas sp. SA4125]|uniref:DNA cytosine methyltransferase n=1 Tax=Aureimonas sp. SA4125 TaxID=2826993 RepID=UPI001CC5A85C|nr:DNA cytosine methyltransferase [Aureimonas sp. SA4125]BDA84001.1 hypothetical protein Sa4125_15430 [Aureimonas sp. SA4125]
MANLLEMAPTIAQLQPDIIVGGPPCQDFSSAGKRTEGRNASLTLGFAIAIVTARPAWFVMENVIAARKTQTYARARALFVKAGYGLTEVSLDGSRYGTPQMRRRFFAIGRLGEADGFLASAIAEAASPHRMSVRDELGDDVGVHPGGNHPPEARAFFMRPYTGHSGVRSIDGPCPTLLRSAHEGPQNWYVDHERDMGPSADIPPLPMDVLSRIQGFPADWNWLDIPQNRRRMLMIANAVPPPLAEAVGRAILARAHGETIPTTEKAFDKWLQKGRKGLKDQALRNRRLNLKKARRLLGGRILANIDAELALLEKAEGFAELSVRSRSELRGALRSHAKWRAEVAAAKALKAELKLYDGMTEADFNARAREEEAIEADHLPFNPRVAASLQASRGNMGELSNTVEVS